MRRRALLVLEMLNGLVCIGCMGSHMLTGAWQPLCVVLVGLPVGVVLFERLH